MRTHSQSVHDQFDSRAQAYLTSGVHAAGPDLARAKDLVRQLVPETGHALDVGCGAGHLSFALAAGLARVVALDPSPNMLATVEKAAAARGLNHIETRQAGAECLPFADRSFSLACTRYSAHHWTRLEFALLEMRRVLQPGGRLLIIDVLGHEEALIDTHLQSVELLRDPSHVRNRSASEWRALLGAAGFVDVELTQWPLRLEFAPWTERMRTPADRVSMIRLLQIDAPREVQEALTIEPDGSFAVTTGLFWARRGE
ncbi:MAG: methyltransferase domain-containing protein [Steroidobacteraceae bacterium]